MAEEKKEENKWTTGDTIGVTIFLTLVGAFAIAFVIGFFMIDDSKAAKTLSEYRSAVRVCGEDNVWEHNYTNGNTDFTCADYSEIQ